MQVDALAVELRPRPMWEAADLGVRLVGAHARSVWRCFVPLWLVVVALACVLFYAAPAWAFLVIFWLKPWLDRSLLFVLSRAVFGRPTQWKDVWQARREVWWQGLLPALTVYRLSPWRSFTLPIVQLEGARGADRAARRRVLLSGQRWAASAVQWAFFHVEIFLLLAVPVLIALFTPQEYSMGLWAFLFSLWEEGDTISQMRDLLVYAAAVLFLEPFFVGAGFAMYLNRRVQLEAWDIEQAFRRAFR